MGTHHLFGNHIPFKINQYTDLNAVPFVTSNELRSHVKVGSYTWSIQASAFHSCSPKTSGDKLLHYVSFEIAGWDQIGTPINSAADLNFLGFGLEPLASYTTTKLIIYDNVSSTILYRVLTHCLLQDLCAKKIEPTLLVSNKGFTCS